MLNIVRILIIGAVVLLVGGIVGIIIAAVSGKKQTSDSGDESYFDGGTIPLILWRFLAAFLTVITLGFAFPWAICMLKRWEVKHTVINGKRLKFTGNGAQLFGRYILWAFLTIITFGIYSIWFGLGMKKWEVKHTVYQNDNSGLKSNFTGGAGGWFVNNVLVVLATVFTLGLAAPWAKVHFMKWEAEHTSINGSPLIFKGTGGQLFVKNLVLAILTPLTLGIYAIFYPVKILKWQYSNTDALYKTNKIQKLARAHEESANVDFAKFKIAANDAELNILKTGIKGNETVEELKTLSDSGNPYAMYMYAKATDNDIELIKTSAGYNYHPALFDYAQTFKDTDEVSYINYLELSARNGNTEAPWILRNLYYKKANAKDISVATEFLKKSVYWFKIALDQEHSEATTQSAQYEKDVEKLALWIASQQKGRGIGAGAVIGIVVGLSVIVLGVLMVIALFFPVMSFGGHAERNDTNIYYPKDPDGDRQRDFYIATRETDGRIFDLSEYNNGYAKIEEYLDENYSGQEDTARVRHYSLVTTNESDSAIKYGIDMDITGVSEDEADVIVYNASKSEVTKVDEFKYIETIEESEMQELWVLVIVKDTPNSFFDVEFEYEYLKKINEIPETNGADTLVSEEQNQPENVSELTMAKAKELVDVQNTAFLLYHFKSLGMIDESKTFQMYTFNDTYETCYAAKGIETVEDLRAHLCKYYTKAYVQKHFFDDNRGYWRIENGVIYFEPNYAMGENNMSTDGIIIENFGNNSYGLTSETEWSGPRTIFVTFEDGDYKVDLFNGPELKNEDAYHIINSLFEMENKSHYYFSNLDMLDMNRSYSRQVDFFEGKITLNANAIKGMNSAEDFRTYIKKFCTMDYHLSKHSPPNTEPSTTDFMQPWFGDEKGIIYASEQYDYAWILKEDTLELTRTNEGYDAKIKQFAAGDPNGNPEKEFTYKIVYDNGGYKVDSVTYKNM